MEQKIIRIDLGGVNAYLGKENENFVLFDTGGHLFMDKEFDNRRAALEKELDRHGCCAENVKLIVLTHGDNDHAANAVYFRNKYNAKIAMHKGDVDLAENPTFEKIMDSHYRSMVLNLVSFLIKGLLRKVCDKIIAEYESIEPDLLIDEGFDLSAYGFDAKIIHIPGHTNGSIGVVTKQGNLICGDTLANTKKPEIAPNARDFKQLAESIKKIKSLDIKTIYPGHGEPFRADLISKL
jgi:hydroxyacylglutathione hydrolase